MERFVPGRHGYPRTSDLIRFVSGGGTTTCRRLIATGLTVLPKAGVLAALYFLVNYQCGGCVSARLAKQEYCYKFGEG